MNIQDTSFLILSYLEISDYEIHSDEIKVQKENFSISEEAKIEHNKILSDEDGKIPIEKLIEFFNNNASFQEKRKLVSMLYQIAYADNFFYQNEKNLLRILLNK